MKAIACIKYGSPDVLQLSEVEKPTPKNNEVLIKIHAASVTTADTMMRAGTPFVGRLFMGLLKPKYPITGTGFAGVVEAIGKDVTLYKKGTPVFGESIFGFGTNAEYVCVSENGVLAKKPSNMTYEEAAPVCDGALTSLSFLQDIGNIQKGQRVLINGASGSLGSSAVQIASYLGAEVCGVCSRRNVEMVRSLGAKKVIDYTKEDFTKIGETYDIVFDSIGKSSFLRCKGLLNKNGIYLSPVLGAPLFLQMICTSMTGGKKAKFSATGLRPQPELRALLGELVKMIEAEKLKSIIDESYALDQTANAHRHIEKGHKKGNVVITM